MPLSHCTHCHADFFSRECEGCHKLQPLADFPAAQRIPILNLIQAAGTHYRTGFSSRELDEAWKALPKEYKELSSPQKNPAN